MTKPVVVYYDSGEELASVLAEDLAQCLKEEVDMQGGASLVLPGGTSPYGLLKSLARVDLCWKKITVTTTDERCVPEDHSASNIGQVKNLLGQVLARWCPLYSPDTSLADSSRQFEMLAKPLTTVVLGMGADGHIASLFPGGVILASSGALCSIRASKLPRERVSLTMETLLEARTCHMLVIGKEKWQVCEDAFTKHGNDLPVATFMRKAGHRLCLHVVK